jgi:hypothetical protein
MMSVNQSALKAIHQLHMVRVITYILNLYGMMSLNFSAVLVTMTQVESGNKISEKSTKEHIETSQ